MEFPPLFFFNPHPLFAARPPPATNNRPPHTQNKCRSFPISFCEPRS